MGLGFMGLSRPLVGGSEGISKDWKREWKLVCSFGFRFRVQKDLLHRLIKTRGHWDCMDYGVL